MPRPSPALPKYLQISRDIIGRIQSGELAVGRLVPSENEIIDHYAVSNTTARRALEEVERAGWVTRVKSRGTYVRDARVGRTVDRILGFTRNMIESGRRPSTRVLSTRVRQSARTIVSGGRRYRLEGPLCRLERLRLADGIPMMKEVRHISLKMCPDIHKEDLRGSLYEVYESRYGLQLLEVRQLLSAVMLESKKELDTFELDEAVPAFLVEGATFCGKELILEMEESLYRGDQYSFSVKATR
jgi:GntR family transcriptional regulator